MNKEAKRRPYAWELEAQVCAQLLDKVAHDAVGLTEDGAGNYTLWYGEDRIDVCTADTFDRLRWARLILNERRARS